ncbi:MAG: hypothetical protein DRM99_05215 [Thermoplasmata archaeon]|nr:MAG: hypothetical protein DRM99_05215 [Thermoplasmata archaeon]
MSGLGRKGETEIECPFCKKAKVRMFHKEGYYQAKVSRISAGAKTTYHWVPDTYEVLEDCPNCGKRKKEIQKALEGEVSTKKLSHKERIKRIKESGLPTRIEV